MPLKLVLPSLLLMLSALPSCANEIDMKIESLKNDIVVGMDWEDVARYLSANSVEYDFSSREQVDKYARPQFQWKSEDAVGIYAALIRDFDAKSPVVSEHIAVKIEIDSRNKVTQVIVKKGYTGP